MLRVDQRVVRPQRKASQDLAVIAIYPARLRRQPGVMLAMMHGQIIPGERRPVMMGSVQMVVEVKQTERTGAFHRRGATRPR